MNDIVIRHLADRTHLLPVLQSWFESEWPGYYGPGGKGSARHDLVSYANGDGIPLGLVAFRGREPCGFAALKREPFPSHPHLFPWAGAAYVKPPLRRQGIGRSLLLALEPQARALGYSRIYCATATSASLLHRCGWQALDVVQHDGAEIGVYQKSV
jgi:GNAT superfamily N-acetyltransferase